MTEGRDQPRYFHGGAPNLSVGDKVLSRAVLPAWRGIRIRYGHTSAESIGDDGSFMHITTDIAVARAHAGEYRAPNGKHQAGALYEVIPIGPTCDDPDYSLWPTLFRRARAARVLAVVEQGLFWSNPRYMARAVAPYRVDRQGDRFLGVDGYISPAMGVSREHARRFGRWIPDHYLTPEFDLKPGETLPPPLRDER